MKAKKRINMSDYMTYSDLIDLAQNNDEETYLKMLIIRKFEENLLSLFSENKLFGTTHTCIGQEAIAVAIMENIESDDFVFSNHRCHGHFISYSKKPELLLKEIMGKSGGICEGKGGSQHLAYNRFFTNGVQGGIVPNAVGVAWAEKIKKTTNISVVFLGDGTLGQGVVYESWNIASLKSIPTLFVIESNGYAMSTKTIDAVAGSIEDRAKAFGIKYQTVDGNDWKAIDGASKKAIDYVRSNSKPYILIVNTYRLASHSKGDDYRDSEEIKNYKKKDPLYLFETNVDPMRIEDLVNKCELYINNITSIATEEEYSKLSDIKTDSKKEFIPEVEEGDYRWYVEYINAALKNIVEKEKNSLIIGEDVCDPYGGAFKTTKGISELYPEQIVNMPISESAMAGITVGLSLNGIMPVTEIMFGDFVTLTFDQLLNHASKYVGVYGKELPFIIRTPMGGKRGYGPTHSQSLEKFLCGIPYINVFALSSLHNAIEVYEISRWLKEPVVIIENKSLYSQKYMSINSDGMLGDFYAREHRRGVIKTYELSLNQDFSSEVVFVTYGGMVPECMEAAIQLMMEDEIAVNVIVLGQLNMIPWEDLKDSKITNSYIYTVEEGTISFGIGSEIIAGLSSKGIGSGYCRIACEDVSIPNSLLMEKELLPNSARIVEKVRENYYAN